MVLVGREKEAALVRDAVSAGRHVVVTGKFGMGKTALSRHVAELVGPAHPFLFASFSVGPARICEVLVSQLPASRRTKAPRKSGRVSYLSLRARLVVARRKGPTPVVVLDDVFRVTAPKAALVRTLALGGIPLILLVDTGLPERDRKRLLAWLEPSERLHLGPLSQAASADLLERLAKRQGRRCSVEQIESLARASGGYPPHLHEMAARAMPVPNV